MNSNYTKERRLLFYKDVHFRLVGGCSKSVWSKNEVAKDGNAFFYDRQLVSLFSAPNNCSEFDNDDAMMIVGETLKCSLHGYSMMEAGPFLAMCLAFTKEPFENKSGTCGTITRNAKLKIVDLETNASLPRNQRGEVCIRGDQIMKGYPNDREATKRMIVQRH